MKSHRHFILLFGLLAGGPALLRAEEVASSTTPVISSTIPVVTPAEAPSRPTADVSQRLADKVIVLDPGHAVLNGAGRIINPGARARRGVYERDVVLKVAEKLAPLLEAQGARVFMTRTPSNPWRYNLQNKASDNRSRAVFANTLRADAYVRLHCDWNRSRKFKGFTTYYFRWGSRPLAKSIHRSLAQALRGHRDHGLRRRTFVSVTAMMPAVLLELGVLSHREEGKKLASEAFQTRLAEAISNGLVEYFSMS